MEGLVEAFRQLAGLQSVVQGGLVRVGLAPGVVLVGFQEDRALRPAGVGEGFLVDVEGLLGGRPSSFEAGDGFGAAGAMGGRSFVLPGSAMRWEWAS